MQTKIHTPYSARRVIIFGRNYSEDVAKSVVLALLTLPLLALQPALLAKLLVISLTVFFWGWLFARGRSETPGVDLVVSALLFTLLLPIDLSSWQLVLIASFGTVIGEQIFGGRGDSFVNPVITGLAFLFYAFTPDAISPVNTYPVGVLALPAVLFLWYRLIDMPYLLAVPIGYLLTVAMTGGAPVSYSLSTAVVTCLLFVACDSAVMPRTVPGRIIIGALVGVAMEVLQSHWLSLEKTVFIILLASVATPLIDYVVSATNANLRGGSQNVVD